MTSRNRTALFVLMLISIACGPIAGGGLPIGEPSPTPPPIPTNPIIPSTSVPTGQPGEVATVPPGQAVSIVYGSARGMDIGLYLLSPGGEFIAPVPVTDTASQALWPDVSPDGQRIAFVSMTSTLQPIGIFTTDLNGQNPIQVTQGDGTHPRWSPDGTRIAYTCNSGSDICVVNASGAGTPANLTADSARIEQFPDWAPDGRIVFASNRDVSDRGLFSEIYIMNPDGTQVTRLTQDNNDNNTAPSVSPDGTRIAFESNRDTGSTSELYIMNIDGSNRIRITNDDLWNQNPVWSPDGQLLLYAQRNGAGNIDLYQINTDGSNIYQLTHDLAEDGGYRLGHAWLTTPQAVADLTRENDPDIEIEPPEGSDPVSNGILFAASNFNCPDCLESGIWFVTFDGANLTQTAANGLHPAWSPEFDRFAFVQNGELFLINADGTGAAQITHGHRFLSSLDWSADGNTILANCQPYGQHDACLIDVATGAINNITETIIYGSGIPYPSWYGDDLLLIGSVLLDPLGRQYATVSFPGRLSPDETQFAAILRRQLVVMNPDGSNQRELTTDSPTKGYPIWSPDSSLIIYTVAPGDGRLYLWAARADGGAPPYQLALRPIAVGPSTRPSSIDTYYGYSWAP